MTLTALAVATVFSVAVRLFALALGVRRAFTLGAQAIFTRLATVLAAFAGLAIAIVALIVAFATLAAFTAAALALTTALTVTATVVRLALALAILFLRCRFSCGRRDG